MSSLELSFGKKFSAGFLENPFIRKVLIAETAFFTTDFMVVRSDLHCIFETQLEKKRLLAPTGALIVMMVYYIYIRSGNFFRFSLSPLMQLMLQVSLLVA